eukprot:710018-Prymnesium_polylepis.1
MTITTSHLFATSASKVALFQYGDAPSFCSVVPHVPRLETEKAPAPWRASRMSWSCEGYWCALEEVWPTAVMLSPTHATRITPAAAGRGEHTSRRASSAAGTQSG